MRDLKFRAWINKLGMAYSDDFFSYPTSVQKVQAFFNWIHDQSPELMQFTGLLDRNSKEIYEGDIIKYQSSPNYPHYAVVGFDTGCFIATFQSGTVWKLHLRVEIGDEVIGNIWENPELSEVRDESNR